MARYKGTFKAPSNYEPLVAAPFDARALVSEKADLTSPSTWVQSDGTIWIYNGMIVSVSGDADAANYGVYVLLDKTNYQLESNWRKLADFENINNLQEQIDNIEVGGNADVEVGEYSSLPVIGMSGVTYYVRDKQMIYRWDAETQSYLSFGGGAADLDIEIIYGGNSNV